VKYSAFLPPSNRRLSVFRISNLGENEIWGIGNSIGAEREITLLARADIKAESVMETGLEIESDANPPLHSNIIGWPDAASEIKLKAIELAEKARLYIKD